VQEQEAPETSGLLLLHHAEGVITPHEVGASRAGGLVLDLLIRAMRGPHAPDNCDGMQAHNGPAKGRNTERKIEHQHDNGAGDRAVEHAEGAEKKSKNQCEDYAFALCHPLRPS
jgi:hypothetical protein